jgi:hypothetical protein
VFVEPGHQVPTFVDPAETVIELPPLAIHQMLVFN